jgi:hypothetical protein
MVAIEEVFEKRFQKKSRVVSFMTVTFIWSSSHSYPCVLW